MQLTRYGSLNELVERAGGRLSHADIKKALLEAGTQPGSDLVYQDLSPTIPILTSGMDDIWIQNAMPKEGAQNLTKDFVVLQDYGYQADDAMFTDEISEGVEDQADYEPRSERLKFMVKKGRVSDAMTLVRSLVEPEKQAVMTESQWMIRSKERNIYYGDEDLNPRSFNGLRKRILTQSPAENVLDAHGGPITFKLLDQAISTVRNEPNFRHPTDAAMSIPLLTDFNQNFIAAAGRTELEREGIRGLNFDFESMQTAAGSVKMRGVPFINTGSRGLISPKQDFTKAPGSPTVGAPTTGPAPSGLKSNFLSSDAGNYIYWVQAVNASGASPMVQANAQPLAVSAGDVVSVPVTMGGQGAALSFTIYRTIKGEEMVTDANGNIKRYEIGRIKNVVTTMGPQQVVFKDDNARMPGTSECFILSMDINSLAWFSLMPLMKIDLAKRATSRDFLLAEIGSFTIKAPGGFVLIRNAKPAHS